MSPALGTDPLKNSLFKRTEQKPRSAPQTPLAGPSEAPLAAAPLPKVPGAPEPPVRLAAFRVGDRLFGADIAQVATIVRMVEIIPVPMAPPFVEGIVNVRGTVVPVVSLGRLFGLKPQNPILRRRIIVGGGAARIALIVDAVSNLYTIEADRIQPVTEATPMAELSRGIARIEQGDTTLVAMILDLEKILSFQQKALLGRSMAEAGGEKAIGELWTKGIEAAEAPTVEAEEKEARERLRDRARVLSLPVVQRKREMRQVLTFALGKETYGLSTTSAARILKPPSLTKLPSPPKYVLGVVNFEGEVLPIVDLGALLGLATGADRKPFVVVAEQKGAKVGFYADEVFHVVDVPIEDIEPPLTTIEKVRGDYIDGEVRIDDHLVILLNWANVMASSEMQKSTGMTAAGSSASYLLPR